ncbi:MAG TPA: hypothetical protein DCP26_03075, partial [Brevundimonas sp.]|nr:hypothetical protein [Brevundimonas sp.]
MGKALKTAGAIIGGAVLMATGVGALAGLQVTAMGIAGLGTMSVASLQLTSAGLMAAGAMLDKPKSTASGSPSDWTSNPDQGIPFLFGRMGVAGKIVHRDEYGPDNRLQGIVTIYSGAGPVKSFQGFTADELPVSFVSNGGTAVGKYNRQMWRSWRMGAQPDTALSLPTGLDGGAVMPMWGPLYKLSGKACDLLTFQQDSKFSVYPSGEPQPMQVLEGVYGYDPRYDDTYPGGAGPCRYGVRSTYRYIDNAIIAALNWALGMIENGQVVGGIGASLQGVDLPAFVEAANIADANAWTVAAWPDTSEDASVVLDELLEAGGAKRSRVAGKISCVSRGAPRPSIVTITRRDTAGAIELDTGASRFNRLNTITPVIMSEAHKWKHAPMNPVAFAPLVAEDGGKRSDQIKYRFVSKVKQGAELAAYDILDAREPFSGTIPLLPHLRRLKPGDCFDIDEPGFMLDGVKMLVLSRSYDARVGEVRIAFRSETDSKHPLALGKTTTMPEYPGLTVPDPTEVTGPLPGDWTIVPRPPGESGVQVPIIDIIGEVSNGTATAVHFEWWVVPAGVDPTTSPPPDAAWQSAGIWPPTVTSIPVQANPGASIWIAASYLRGENFSQRKLYGPITVPGLTAGNVIPTAPTIVGLQGQINAAFGGIFDVSELLADARTQLDAQGAEIAAARGGQATLNARISQVNQARIDGDEANAIAISGVAARTAHTEADIIDLENALANETMARAEAVGQLTARQALNPNLTPNGNFEAGSSAGWGLPAGFGAGYSSFNGGWIAYGELTSGTVRNVQAPLTSVSSDVAAIQSSQIAYRMASNAYVAACVMFFDAGYGYIEQTPWEPLAPTTDWTAWKAEGYTKPAAAAWSRIVVTTGGTEGFINLRQAKTEAGSVCTIYSSDASVSSLSATVTDQALAIVDLENQQALAAYELLANASGGLPAFLRLISSTAGGYAALAAPVVALLNSIPGGDLLVAMQAIGGEVFFPRPVYVDLGGRRLIMGPGSGWVLWFGPDTINAAGATRTNGYFALGTDGKVYYGNAELGGGKTGGARSFSSGPGGSSAQSTVPGVLAGSMLEATGAINGGSLDADAPLFGTISLYEESGGVQTLVY